jgi:IstB-like ATP binding protein
VREEAGSALDGQDPNVQPDRFDQERVRHSSVASTCLRASPPVAGTLLPRTIFDTLARPAADLPETLHIVQGISVVGVAEDSSLTEWVAHLSDAQRHGRLDQELDKLQRLPLLIVDEVGYIPFDPQAANLMFMLVSRRYERASLIVTSNKPFSAWGEIFGDEVTAAAMIDRLIHHAEILSLKGDSYRLKDRDLAGTAPPEN